MTWRIQLTVATVLLIGSLSDAAETIPLAGSWRFRRDDASVGVEQKWFAAALVGDAAIPLPGSMDEAKIGDPYPKIETGQLHRPIRYFGAAWYQRDVTIPESWRGKRVELFLERAFWQTDAWLDERPLGMRDSLCTPHRYDLGIALEPGLHRLTIRVDNRVKYNLGEWAHSITETTQTKWNGLIGRLELRATPPVWLEDVQVYPDVDQKQVRVVVQIGNATGNAGRGILRVGKVAVDASWDEKGGRAEVVADMPDARLWDEFAPDLSEVIVELGDDRRVVPFGMRKFVGKPTGQFEWNGRPTFLRGTLECCIFPLTGHPAMDEAAWTRIFCIAKEYGLNHMRFHSWCPPEAAFAAADEAGMLLQVEAPQWAHDVGDDKPRDEFVRQEMLRILATYGNHPSFVMFTLGNELASKQRDPKTHRGDFSVMNGMIALAKQTDPRHLYSATSNPEANSCGDPQEGDDFLVLHTSRQAGRKGWVMRRCQELLNVDTPCTSDDYRGTLAGLHVPAVSHEVGQWSSYPNLDEIAKYTGVLQPTAQQHVHDVLAAKGWLHLAPAWTLASGRFVALLYKEEVERSLRTPNYGGFQLLDLRDFPGQGGAFVGVLDAFWDNKGFVTAAEWRRFCGPTVLLARMSKRVWTNDETFTAQAELAHYGPSQLVGVSTEWKLQDGLGRVLASGQWPARDVPTGGLTSLGELSVPLRDMVTPSQLTLTVSAPGTAWNNAWPVWIYASNVDTTPPAGLVVSTAWDDATRAALGQGQKVLLLASEAGLNQSGDGKFAPGFWKSGSQYGVLCDPRHPALAKFPTDSFSNWQWHELLTRSRRMRIDDLPGTFLPIVEIVGDAHHTNRWSDLFEARVGEGRLLVCSIDLQTDLAKRPVARQLLRSLFDYAASEAFQPSASLTCEQLDTVLLRAGSPAATANPPSEEKKN